MHSEDQTSADRPTQRVGFIRWEGDWPQTLEEFKLFVRAFKDKMVRYAYRRLECIEEAQDVAQEVLIKAFNEREKFRRVKQVDAYLFRMIANLCNDHLRKRSNQVMDPLNDELVDDNAAVVAPRAELERIERLLAPLPAGQAEVIRLHVLDKLSFPDIAQMLQVPVATVKSRFRYGIEKLRELLAGELEVLK